jgi:predicted RNA binding protein YcfA (HicA-like mRNA interferase family)
VPPFGPIQRRELVAALKSFGFHGPFAGGKHEYMVSDSLRITLPNPQHGEIGQELLGRILKQAGISRRAWESRS